MMFAAALTYFVVKTNNNKPSIEDRQHDVWDVCSGSLVDANQNGRMTFDYYDNGHIEFDEHILKLMGVRVRSEKQYLYIRV